MSEQLLHVLLVLGVIAALWGLIHWSKNRNIGKQAPNTAAVDDENLPSLRVYYFFSRSCGPCKEMALMVEKLRQQHDNLIKLDIAVHSQLARDFGIVGVPSFIVVENEVIKTIKLGRTNESWLMQWLAD